KQRGVQLPRSTIGNAESGQVLPTQEVLNAFLKACDVSETSLVAKWEATRDRINAARSLDRAHRRISSYRDTTGEGRLPRIWNVPARNPNFVGRKATLRAMAQALTSQPAVTVHSVHGLGGVGKTQLANEFAHA